MDQSVHSVKVMYRPVVNQSDAAWHTLINCHEHTLQANIYFQASSSFMVRSSQAVPNTVMADSMPKLYFRFQSSQSAIPVPPNYMAQYLLL